MKKTLTIFTCILTTGVFAQTLDISLAGRFTDGRDGASEISTYDAEAAKIYVTNAAVDSIDIVDISDITNPMRVGQIDVLSYGGGVNSVLALGNGYVAAAIEANTKTDDGKVVIYDTAGTYVTDVTVGALPDMIALSHDGNTILVANEGEPNDDYDVDPEGSVSVIDISGGISSLSQSNVSEITFKSDSSAIPGSVRKPGTTWNIDLEPEYIVFNDDDSKAFVACQEANVLVVLDLSDNSVAAYVGLGYKDHSQTGNALDPSNRDDGIFIANWPVHGIYMPDAIASYTVGGSTYVVSANEGDGRDYNGYSSEERIKDLTLDPTVFPNAADLQADSNLGRLKTISANVIGDTDGDGDVDELYSYGARSFSIWDDAGALVYDSGDDFEQYIKDNYGDWFNCNDGLKSEMDDRSDDKGPEPEAVTVGQFRNQFFAFVGLERQGGIMVYNITDPNAPVFETFLETYDDGSGMMTDIAPEGIVFVSADDSHNEKNMLIVSNEVSGTVVIYEIIDLYAGVGELNPNAFDVELFPNPANGVLNIKVDTEVNYALTSITGAVAQSGRLNNVNNSIDISNVNSGVYVITLTDDSQNRVVRKLIVE